MAIDPNEFFREATKRVCGHLEIEKAMHSCMRFLAPHFPADYLFLQIYEFELGAIRTIAKATRESGQILDQVTSLPAVSRGVMETETFPAVMTLNYPNMSEAGKTMLDYHGIKDASLLMLMLGTQGGTLGHLILVAENRRTFTEKQAELYENLKEPFTIALANTLRHREVIKLKELLADDNRFLHRELARTTGDEVIGANFGLKGVMDIARQVASHDSPVLLLGETGTGKDVIANVIHYSSTRGEGPFITVNCGAIPDALIDSELFGHEKGAFTGALSQKRGRFERAHEGTIFLDEIGELPAAAQVRLLRVLQNQEIERVGGTTPITINIRVIAATHRNLEEMVANGEFREDLWFRLNVVPISIPPLRDRKADIPSLVQHFIEKKARELKLRALPRLARGAIDDLTTYEWPGNVRELENVLERAIILAESSELSFSNLVANHASSSSKMPEISAETPLELDDMIAFHIQSVLQSTEGKIHGPGGAAELLGLNASTLRGKMNKLGIPYGRGAKTQ